MNSVVGRDPVALVLARLVSARDAGVRDSCQGELASLLAARGYPLLDGASDLLPCLVGEPAQVLGELVQEALDMYRTVARRARYGVLSFAEEEAAIAYKDAVLTDIARLIVDPF